MIELIVVIVIMTILTTIVVMSTRNANTNAPKRCEADFQAVRTAAASYYAANSNTFATSVQALRQSGHLKSDPPQAPGGGSITATAAPHGYALALSQTSADPVVHVWGADKTWATADDASGTQTLCTSPSSGL